MARKKQAARKRPEILIEDYGVRRINEHHMADLGTIREGRMVSVDRGQFGECQNIILDMLADAWDVDPIAVLQTIERHRAVHRKAAP